MFTLYDYPSLRGYQHAYHQAHKYLAYFPQTNHHAWIDKVITLRVAMTYLSMTSSDIITWQGRSDQNLAFNINTDDKRYNIEVLL